MQTKTDFLLNNIRECLFDIATINKNTSRNYDIADLVARALDYLIDLDIEFSNKKPDFIIENTN